MATKRTFSQPGTARALVLLASALAMAGAALTFLLALVFGPALLDRQGLTGTVLAATAMFSGLVLVSAVVANLLALRVRSTRGIVGVGCGTLLAGVVIGIGVLLLVIARAG
ncbi:hypothetical protein [Actinophytocola glycyrrhizae]|uniref:Major facilitator superfamily (MFS) profile domain-containing protein n=1 Tax=Actinophytocola glycyrrhizae TaxID=2044873 RepID=A0ABV9S188_9PSEU